MRHIHSIDWFIWCLQLIWSKFGRSLRSGQLRVSILFVRIDPSKYSRWCIFLENILKDRERLFETCSDFGIVRSYKKVLYPLAFDLLLNAVLFKFRSRKEMRISSLCNFVFQLSYKKEANDINYEFFEGGGNFFDFDYL